VTQIGALRDKLKNFRKFQLEKSGSGAQVLGGLPGAFCLWVDESSLLQGKLDFFDDSFCPTTLRACMNGDFFVDLSTWLLPMVMANPPIEVIEQTAPRLKANLTVESFSLESRIEIASVLIREPFIKGLDSLFTAEVHRIFQNDTQILASKARKVFGITSQLEQLDKTFMVDLSGLYKTIVKRGTQLKKSGAKTQMLLEYDYKERAVDHDLLALIQANRTSADSYCDTELVDSLTCVSGLKVLHAISFVQNLPDGEGKMELVKLFYTLLDLVDSALAAFPPCEKIIKSAIKVIGNQLLLRVEIYSK
jgi:hypothetical protein